MIPNSFLGFIKPSEREERWVGVRNGHVDFVTNLDK
jgi:hypothetical protein